MRWYRAGRPGWGDLPAALVAGNSGSVSAVDLAMADVCTHLDQIADGVTPGTSGCQECLAIGGAWVHLRLCLTCGHVGCCDSSRNRHATRHFRDTEHPVIRSFEPGEEWDWCYVDEVMLTP